jgi:glycine/D-amino acid oxidase-like deaminating enzyme
VGDQLRGARDARVAETWNEAGDDGRVWVVETPGGNILTTDTVFANRAAWIDAVIKKATP